MKKIATYMALCGAFLISGNTHAQYLNYHCLDYGGVDVYIPTPPREDIVIKYEDNLVMTMKANHSQLFLTGTINIEGVRVFVRSGYDEEKVAQTKKVSLNQKLIFGFKHYEEEENQIVYYRYDIELGNRKNHIHAITFDEKTKCFEYKIIYQENFGKAHGDGAYFGALEFDSFLGEKTFCPIK
ncbi:MAG: hypothetical protein R3A11_08860 [Bdellovibrionota bacterium]